MTEEDVARLETVGEIAVSPDGSRVAWLTNWLPDVIRGEKDAPARGQLMIGWNAEVARSFLQRGVDAARISFSPDGATIAFISAEATGKQAVWGIPVDGGAHRKLAEVPGSNMLDFGWSPDGSRLVLLVAAEEDPIRKRQDEAGFDAIVFEEEHRFNRLFVARLGEEADPAPVEIPLPGHVDAIRLSPDGSFVAVASAPTPLVDDDRVAKRVKLVDLASGRVTATIETFGKLVDFEISPDSRKVAVVAAADAADAGGTTLYSYDIPSRALVQLNRDAPEAALDTSFLPDGRLAAVIHKGIGSLLRLYRPDGSVEREVDPGPLILEAVMAADGKVMVRANAPTHPDEMFELADEGFNRWTFHNRWLSEIDFGTQRRFAFTARDGLALDGVLIEPVGGVKRGGAPTILDIHGGPESHDSNGWTTTYSSPGQVAAGLGYAVFLPNYRGSIGYGVAFSKLQQGDYAGKEFDDLVDAKRALVAAGVSDPERVGMTGGSYGGYATAWAATAQSEEFAAGVMMAGISDNISKFGTTDIPREMVEAHALVYPWDDWGSFLESSPIYHAGKANTPLLILHGQRDARVPPGQAMELYRAIRTQTDTPVRLVLYPREAHGMRMAAARYDVNLRMMRWFDTYLRPGRRTAPLPPSRPVIILIQPETSED